MYKNIATKTFTLAWKEYRSYKEYRSWCFELRLKQWNLFSQWLGNEYATSAYLKEWDPVQWHKYVSRDSKALMAYHQDPCVTYSLRHGHKCTGGHGLVRKMHAQSYSLRHGHKCTVGQVVMVLSEKCTHSLSPWWRHQMEAFSALLALCALNSPVTGEFPPTKASDAELWCFLWSTPEQTVE